MPDLRSYWFATVTLIPNQNFAVLVAGNRGGDQGAAACDALTLQVLQEYSEHTPGAMATLAWP